MKRIIAITLCVVLGTVSTFDIIHNNKNKPEVKPVDPPKHDEKPDIKPIGPEKKPPMSDPIPVVVFDGARGVFNGF